MSDILDREKMDRPMNERSIRGLPNIRIKGLLHPICPTCKGIGHIRVQKFVPCPNPHYADDLMDESYTKRCDTCNGKGWL